ncbi:carbohydrate ABC transporter permease [Micromonospora craniellae]|nr:carbohydrate ABC transporter permease [Micromonospora craniellae]QOC92284.1 carbohydrate ABC transporter permease [Micromonospora craniellae]
MAGVLAGAVLIIVWSVAPFLWLLRSSLSPSGEMTRVPISWWPETVTFASYADLLAALFAPGDGTTTAQLIALGLQNSMVVGVVVTVINVVLGFAAAYGFSRARGRGWSMALNGLIISRMVPMFAIIIPLFLLFSRVGIYDTYLALVLAELAVTLPFSIWLMKSYLDTIDVELDEQALVDGATKPQMLRLIMLPAARPGVATAAIFTFLTSWNSFIFPLVLSSSPTVMTVQPQIAATYSDMRADYDVLFASTVLACVPPMILAFILQRQLTRGLLSGAIKG